MDYIVLNTVVVLISFFLVSDIALADVNKCTTKAGKIEYRDGPCEGTGISVTVVKKRDNVGENTPSANYPNNMGTPTPAPSAPRAEAIAPAPAATSSSVIQSERRPKRLNSSNNRPTEYLQ